MIKSETLKSQIEQDLTEEKQRVAPLQDKTFQKHHTKWSKGWKPPEGARIPERLKDPRFRYYQCLVSRVLDLQEQGYIVDDKLTKYYQNTNNHVIDSKPMTSAAVSRGLIVMKIPIELWKQRNEHYRKLNEASSPQKSQKRKLQQIAGCGNIYGDISIDNKQI